MRALRTALPGALVLLFASALRAQCPDGQDPIGQELAINGDFSAGDQYFSSGYVSCPGPCNTEATYTVLSDPTIANPGFSGADHTDGTGLFMAVNGDPVAGTSVWCQTIVVEPGLTYVFSAWVSSLSVQYPAQLLFSINGVDLATAINAPPATGEWVPFNATWDAGSATTATICIVNNNTSVAGNDFGLDDISFRACCRTIPDPSQTLVACNRTPITLEAPEGYTYLWNTGDTTRTLQVTPAENGRWTLALFSTCTSRAAEYNTVLLDTAVADVFLPNTFTPNGDGINEVFGVTSHLPITGELLIYDRWGHQVQALTVNDVWKGDAGGEPCPVGVYIYQVHTTNVCDQKIERTGHITLLR